MLTVGHTSYCSCLVVKITNYKKHINDAYALLQINSNVPGCLIGISELVGNLVISALAFTAYLCKLDCNVC